MNPTDNQLTFRRELYTEIVRDGVVVGAYKQNGHVRVFELKEVSASGLDRMLGADKAEGK